MDKKAKLEAFVADAGKKAKGLLDNAIQSVDQNDDGKFDFADVSVIAEQAKYRMSPGDTWSTTLNSNEDKCTFISNRGSYRIWV